MPRTQAQDDQGILVEVTRGGAASWGRQDSTVLHMTLEEGQEAGRAVIREATRLEQLMMKLDGLRRLVKYDPPFYRRKVQPEIRELEKEIRGILREERRRSPAAGKGGSLR